MPEKREILGKIIGPEEAASTLLVELLEYEDRERLKLITDVTAKEVFYISFLESIISKFGSENVKILNEYIGNFLKLRISMWREGRKEVIDASLGLRALEEWRKRFAAELTKGLR